MLYLIQNLLGWLLAVALAAAFAGWSYRRMRNEGEDARLERDIARERRMLVDLVEGRADVSIGEFERETETLRAMGEVREARIADLERQLADARRGREESLARIAEVERERDRFAAAPQALAPAPIDPHAHWRTRFLEARVRHLEGRPDHTGERDELQARLAAMEAAMPADRSDEINRLTWRTRYAEARMRYLESTEPAPAPQALAAPPADEEAERRRAWRMFYLERRTHYLGEASRTAEAAGRAAGERIGAAEARAASLSAELAAAQARVPPLETELAAARVRIAALEAEKPDPRALRRQAWRLRYLRARVDHLEALRAQPMQSVAAPVEPEPVAAGQLVPPGAEVRPPGLPAPRFGAADDLTLIEGVSLQQESTLHSLGVYHFDQIAAWTRANVAWVDQYLYLKGRIIRERWVEQADSLAQGLEPELAEAE